MTAQKRLTLLQRALERADRSGRARVWLRDHGAQLWQAEYDVRYPRPSDAVSVTQPGA